LFTLSPNSQFGTEQGVVMKRLWERFGQQLTEYLSIYFNCWLQALKTELFAEPVVQMLQESGPTFDVVTDWSVRC